MTAVLQPHSASAQAAACPTPRKNYWAVYLAWRYMPGVPWGGHHVTIAGFRNDHACGGSMERRLEQAWATLHKNKPFKFEPTGKPQNDTQQVVFDPARNRTWFDSAFLTKQFAPALLAQGFKDIKGPASGHKWHVSLYRPAAQQAAEWAALKNRPWRLFLARWPDAPCRNMGINCPKDFWVEVAGQKEGPEE